MAKDDFERTTEGTLLHTEDRQKLIDQQKDEARKEQKAADKAAKKDDDES